MQKLTVFLKQLRLRQILTTFLAIAVLFVGTACNSGNMQGARPNNPPVQAGGSNNPYKQGGDNYTQYKASPDPKLKSEVTQSEVNIASISNQLIAASEELQYPGAQTPANRPAIEKALPKIDQQDIERAEPGSQIQRSPDVGDRVQNRLGKVKETFDEASEFINEGAAEALERHEAEPKPGLR